MTTTIRSGEHIAGDVRLCPHILLKNAEIEDDAIDDFVEYIEELKVHCDACDSDFLIVLPS